MNKKIEQENEPVKQPNLPAVEKKMLHNMFRCYGTPNTTDYNTVAASFNCTRKLKNQNYDRLMNHFVISLNEKATQEFGLDGLKEITEAYIEPIAKDFQLVYAIHEDKGKTLHSHIAFNHTSYTTGLRHRRPKGFINQELDRLQAIVNQIREKKST